MLKFLLRFKFPPLKSSSPFSVRIKSLTSCKKVVAISVCIRKLRYLSIIIIIIKEKPLPEIQGSSTEKPTSIIADDGGMTEE